METFSALLAFCAGNSPAIGEFPAQRPMTRSFDVFFDVRLNKRLSKQAWAWWFEKLSHPLWRHCNGFLGSQMFGLNEYLGAKCQCYLQKESTMLYRWNTVLLVAPMGTDLYTYKPCSFMLWTCCSKVIQTSTYHLLSQCISTVAAYVILSTNQLHQLYNHSTNWFTAGTSSLFLSTHIGH